MICLGLEDHQDLHSVTGTILCHLTTIITLHRGHLQVQINSLWFELVHPPLQLSYTAVILLGAPRQLTWVAFHTVWIQVKAYDRSTHYIQERIHIHFCRRQRCLNFLHVAHYQDADQEAYFHHPQILVEAFHHILNHCLAHVQLRAWHPQ